jgi:uncharacterized protein YbjT (DUF2867 family)
VPTTPERKPEPPRPQRQALVAGASGLTGSQLLRLLLDAPEYARVHAISRRPLPVESPRLANRILPLEQLRTQLAGVHCQDAFCCLGSTLRRAGSEAERRKVDLDLTMVFARAAKGAGATRFVVITSAGADSASRNPYLRVKGELEQALRELHFDGLDVIRPGLLLGARDELRPLELAGRLVMPLVNPLMRGRHARWRGISARDAAAAMLGAARARRAGVHAYEGDTLPLLAAAGRRAIP